MASLFHFLDHFDNLPIPNNYNQPTSLLPFLELFTYFIKICKFSQKKKNQEFGMMASWLMNNQKLSSPMGLMINKDEMNMSSYNVFGQNQKTSLDLMQNCDLPPPLKVFSCPDKSVLLSPMNDDNVKETNIELKQELGSDRLEVLKALRRSQTRAREAERKYLALCKEKEALSNLMLDESARSLAYRNWIKVLELQILQLKRQNQQQQYEHVDRWNRTKEDENGTNGVTWFIAVAFCLGIAAIGCRYFV